MATVNWECTVLLVQLLVCGYSSAQGTGGCNPDPQDTLVSCTSNGILSISINSRMKSGNKVSENTVLVV